MNFSFHQSKPHKSSEDSTHLLFWILVFACLLLGFNVVLHLAEPIGDEAVHAFQINWFIEGIYEIFEYVTVVPVYHAANAFLASLLGDPTLETLRLANLLLSALAIPAFLILTKRFYPAQAYGRCLQFVFLPCYFPLFFLIYTDFFSLTFTLLMIERTLAKKYKSAALFALVAVFSRQPNLVWLAYCALLILLESGRVEWTVRFVLDYCRRAWPLALVALIFMGFVLVNGGVAAGDTEQHTVSFNPTNFYFLLLTAFVLFLPYCVARTTDVWQLARAHKWIGLPVLLMFFVFMQSWELTHIYNDRSLVFYRHNLVLHTINDHYWLKVASYCAMAWMTLTFVAAARADRKNQALIWLLPFAFLSVVPLPLIEHRYYLVPLCIFLAMRPPVPEKVTAFTLVYYIIAACYILYNITRMNFFL